MGLIYKITSPSGKLYVGQTRQSAERRCASYKSKRVRFNKSLVLRSIKKYGWEAHTFEIIEDGVPNELLNDREVYWVAELKTYIHDSELGMNLTKGGDNRESWKNDKTRVERAKMRKGEKSPSWGKKWPDEMKKKIAEGVSKYNKANGVKPSQECHRKAMEKRIVPVVVYDRAGEFVGEYPYIKAASDALGVDRKCAIDAVNGKQVHAGGYLFRKREEGYPMKIDVSGLKLHFKNRAVVLYVAGEVMAEYDSPKEAAQELGLFHQTIKDSANANGKPLRNGYSFYYKDSFEGIPQQQNRPDIQGALVLKW